jgi:hypothetical protein
MTIESVVRVETVIESVSEAIHGPQRKNGLLRRFAPRNDVNPDMTPRSRGAMRPRFGKNFAPRN